MAKDIDELLAEGEAKLRASRQQQTNINLLESAVQAKNRGYFPEMAAVAGVVGASVLVDKKLTKNILEASKQINQAIKAENALVDRLDNSKSQPFAKPKKGMGDPIKIVNKSVETQVPPKGKYGNFAPATRLGTAEGVTMNGQALSSLTPEQKAQLARRMGIEKLLKYVGKDQTANTTVSNPKVAFDARGADKKVGRYVTNAGDVAEGRSVNAKPIVAPASSGSRVGNAMKYLGTGAWNALSHPYVVNTLKAADIARTTYNVPENAQNAMNKAKSEGAGPIGQGGAALTSGSEDMLRQTINLRTGYIPEMLGLYDMAFAMSGNQETIKKVEKEGGGLFGWYGRGIEAGANAMEAKIVANQELKLKRKLTEQERKQITLDVTNNMMGAGGAGY